MSRPTVWPWLKPFFVLLLVVAIPPLTYWFVYVKHTVEAAKQQSYATLAAVAANFKDRVAAHDQIAVTAESSAKANANDLQSLKEYLQSVLQPKEITIVAEESAHLFIGGENGGLYVHVGKFAKDNPNCSQASGCSIRAVVAFETLIPWQIVEPEFDGLLVLSDSGSLLAQDHRLPAQALGMRMPVRDGAALLDYAQLLGGSAQETPKQEPTPSLSPFDFRTERSIELAGVEYLVFMQPVSVAVTNVAHTTDMEKSLAKPIRFFVCGLVRKDRLRTEAIKLSPQTMTLSGSLVALGLFAIPFLKLRFIGSRERMRRRDLWLLCASLLCVTALLALLVLDRHTRDKLHDRFDHGLRQFSESLIDNLSSESAAAVQQLQTTGKEILRTLDASDIESALSEHCGTSQSIGSVLASDEIAGASVDNYLYPDFEAIYVTDRCGNQFRKWMPRTTPTPNVDSLSQPFYSATFALNNRPFAFSSLTARASGLLLGVYTQPLDLKAKQFNSQIAFPKRTGIAAIATPMRSVNEPVVPQPFQFVLVNRQGEVTFQQAQGPFRGERFFEAVGAGQTLERAALDNRILEVDDRLSKSNIVRHNYRGRIYRMNAIDIPQLQQTLVAYYDESAIDSLAARIFATAATFAALVIVCILFGAALAGCWFGERAHDWLWPTASRTTMYLVGGVVCIAAMLVAALARAISSSSVMAALLLLAPIVAMLALGSSNVTGGLARLIKMLGLRDGSNAKTRQTRFAYQAFIIAGLLVFIAFPTVLIVDDAFLLHTTAYENSVVNSLNTARAKSQRVAATDLINIGTAMARLSCKPKSGMVRDLRCVLPERTYATKDNYANLLATRNKWGVYRNCVNLHANSVKGSDICSIAPPPWSFTVDVANQLARFSNKPEVALAIAAFAKSQSHLSATPLLSGFSWSTWSVGGFLTLLAALCLLVGSVAKHVLGIELSNRLALDESAEFKPADGTQWLLLRPTTNLATIDQSATYINLRDATLSPNFVSPGAGTILVVRHIEARIAASDWRAALLLLLRTPAAGCVVLDSEIDPLLYLLDRSRETEEALALADAATQVELQKLHLALQEELTSWSTALRSVRKIRYLLPPPPPIHAKTNAVRLARECACSEPLMEIGKRIGKLEHKIEDYRWDEVVGFVLDAAEPYYRSVWDVCSHEEQLVLIQLAQEGLVNPKRIETIKHLARRRLVSVDPRFCLMNDSFRSFVLNVSSREHIEVLERTPANSAWSRLGTPLYALAAVIIAILLFTEQEAFTSLIAIVTGAAGTLGSMRNLYSSTIKPAIAISKNA